jgi:4-amino-4-deoxy-L-arabinose transferase-like glycosyltransferase
MNREHAPENLDQTVRVDVAAVTLLALVVRLLWVKFGSWESGDSQWYLETARNLAVNHLFSVDGINPTAFRPPLYSSLIASLWLGDSAPVFPVLLVQSILGALTVTLVYLIARRQAGRGVALIASAGMALAPMTGRFTAVILTETLFTFLVTLGIFLWGRKQYALTGVAFGLGILTRVTLLPFVLLLPLLTLIGPWRANRRGYMTIALLSLVLSSVWIVRNAIVFHRFIPVASSGYGTNLLLGSLEIGVADDVPQRKALLKSVDTASSAASSDETEFDRVRLRAAIQRITQDPGRWLRARAQQYPRLLIDSGSYLFGSEGIAFKAAMRERKFGQVVVRSIFIVGNLLVFALAFFGVVAQRSQFASLTHIILFPVFLCAIALPLWIEPRYGLPMMPSVAILSAIGAIELWHLMQRRVRFPTRSARI